MRRADKIGLAASLCIFVGVILGIIGYVMNVIALFNCDFDPMGKEEYIRLAGLVPFVGAIAGWINF